MAKDFTVESVRSTTAISPTGQLVDYFEVFATTAKGDTFIVRVERTLTEQQIAARVSEEAKKLLAIRAL